MAVLELLIVAAIIYVLFRIFFGSSAGPALYCTSCGTQGKARITTRGSFAIEIVLWLCLIVPGLIYSLWRLTTRARTCRACGATTLVPINSPAAVALRKRFGAQ